MGNCVCFYSKKRKSSQLQQLKSESDSQKKNRLQSTAKEQSGPENPDLLISEPDRFLSSSSPYKPNEKPRTIPNIEKIDSKGGSSINMKNGSFVLPNEEVSQKKREKYGTLEVTDRRKDKNSKSEAVRSISSSLRSDAVTAVVKKPATVRNNFIHKTILIDLKANIRFKYEKIGLKDTQHLMINLFTLLYCIKK